MWDSSGRHQSFDFRMVGIIMNIAQIFSIRSSWIKKDLNAYSREKLTALKVISNSFFLSLEILDSYLLSVMQTPWKHAFCFIYKEFILRKCIWRVAYRLWSWHTNQLPWFTGYEEDIQWTLFALIFWIMISSYCLHSHLYIW